MLALLGMADRPTNQPSDVREGSQGSYTTSNHVIMQFDFYMKLLPVSGNIIILLFRRAQINQKETFLFFFFLNICINSIPRIFQSISLLYEYHLSIHLNSVFLSTHTYIYSIPFIYRSIYLYFYLSIHLSTIRI